MGKEDNIAQHQHTQIQGDRFGSKIFRKVV